MYFAISGAGGIGKTTSLNWLTEHFQPSMDVVALPDFMEPPNMDWPIEEIVIFLARQKLKRNAVISEYTKRGVVVFADRTCLDPLALAMTLLSEERWRELEEWYKSENFVYGHHILLDAPHSVIRDRRIGRGSSPRTTWLKSFDISPSQYEIISYKNWLHIHKERNIPFGEIDFSSPDPQINCERLLDVITPLIVNHTKSCNL